MDYLFNSESKLELLKKLSIWSPQEKNIKQDYDINDINDINDIDIFMNYYVCIDQKIIE
jgi:hypothetical protein